jgi:hypothetical protein
MRPSTAGTAVGRSSTGAAQGTTGYRAAANALHRPPPNVPRRCIGHPLIVRAAAYVTPYRPTPEVLHSVYMPHPEEQCAYTEVVSSQRPEDELICGWMQLCILHCCCLLECSIRLLKISLLLMAWSSLPETFASMFGSIAPRSIQPSSPEEK